MRRTDRFRLGLVLIAALMLPPVSGFAQASEEPKVHDCGERKCGEWLPRDDKTCRTCSSVQCKTVQGGDALAGTKTETECYLGHGPPPSEEPKQ